MLSGPGSLYECERRGRLAYWLWTREEAKALSKITFKFDNKLKARVSKLCSSHSSSKQNRKILDEIFLSVAEQSPAMKKLWLSIELCWYSARHTWKVAVVALAEIEPKVSVLVFTSKFG